MKESQTFKLDPKLLKLLRKEAERLNRPFNNYVETILLDRHKTKNQ